MATRAECYATPKSPRCEAKWIRWALANRTRMPARAHQLLLVIAAHADASGVASLTCATLMATTGLSDRTVARGIRDLENLHLVTVARSGDGLTANRYTVYDNPTDLAQIQSEGKTWYVRTYKQGGKLYRNESGNVEGIPKKGSKAIPRYWGVPK